MCEEAEVLESASSVEHVAALRVKGNDVAVSMGSAWLPGCRQRTAGSEGRGWGSRIWSRQAGQGTAFFISNKNNSSHGCKIHLFFLGFSCAHQITDVLYFQVHKI